ncbi:MAG: hypothetical protein PGN25_05575 [Methylorubrum populi]
MKPTLITENGKAVTKRSRLSKVRRAAARPDMEIARLRRCITSIRAEAEKADDRARQIEALLQSLMRVTHQGDPTLTRAMVREVCIEVPAAMRTALLVRYCEMAEEGTLCA